MLTVSMGVQTDVSSSLLSVDIIAYEAIAVLEPIANKRHRVSLILLRPDCCAFPIVYPPAPLIERTAPLNFGLTVVKGGPMERLLKQFHSASGEPRVTFINLIVSYSCRRPADQIATQPPLIPPWSVVHVVYMTRMLPNTWHGLKGLREAIKRDWI